MKQGGFQFESRDQREGQTDGLFRLRGWADWKEKRREFWPVWAGVGTEELLNSVVGAREPLAGWLLSSKCLH